MQGPPGPGSGGRVSGDLHTTSGKGKTGVGSGLDQKSGVKSKVGKTLEITK